MKNIRIKYEIGLQNGNKYHVRYSVLCNERNQNVELLKANNLMATSWVNNGSATTTNPLVK